MGVPEDLEARVWAFAESEADRVRDLVIAAAPELQVAALCLSYTDGPGLLVTPASIRIGLVTDRVKAVEVMGSPRPFWRSGGWTGGEVGCPSLEGADADLEAELSTQLQGADVDDHARFVLDRVAHVLCRRDWAPELDVSDDFVVFPYPQEFPTDLLESLAFAVPRGVHDLLEARGYLRVGDFD